MTTLQLLLVLAPIWCGLVLVGYVAYRTAGKVEHLIQRCDDIDFWDGTMDWPIDADDCFVEALRNYAGDEDDTRRKYLESAIALSDRRH